MFGLARTDDFMLSTATLMVGALGQVANLNPSTHAIGLVKNLVISQDTTLTELTQGITNDVVASLVTGNSITGSCEVYEYTSRNLAYGLMLDGTQAAFNANTLVHNPNAAINAAATTLTLATDLTTTYTVGSWIFIQDMNTDRVHIARVSASAFATATTTVTFAGYAIPAGVTFPATTTRVGKVNKLDSSPSNTNFSMKIVGQIADTFNTPVTILIPKAKITKGFSMAFNADNFGNLPFEFVPYVPVPTDPGYDANFAQRLHVFVQ
jgi:hypothetical protein